MPGTEHENNIPYHEATDVNDFVNDRKIIEIRQDIINDRRSKHCYKCWDIEDAGMVSIRQLANQIHTDKSNKTPISETGRIENHHVEYLDITLGNICNLKCRSCSPSCSHTWIAEAKALPIYDLSMNYLIKTERLVKDPWFVAAFKNKFYDPILPTVKIINFLGGEPLVVKEHYDWLQHMIDQGWSHRIELRYNTNGTIIPKKILDIWKRFKKVILSISLDAAGPLAYYVRYPSKWSDIQANIKKLKEHCIVNDNIRIHIHTTVSSLNIMDLDRMVDWCVETRSDWLSSGLTNFESLFPHINVVSYPDYLAVKHVPSEIKERMIAVVDSIYDKYKNMPGLESWQIEKLHSIKNLVSIVTESGDQQQWSKFLEVTRQSDAYRKVDIKDYIAWTKDYL
jgi:sulfatase maturation enzyme AslB (radical SAM superfamily)